MKWELGKKRPHFSYAKTLNISAISVTVKKYMLLF